VLPVLFLRSEVSEEEELGGGDLTVEGDVAEEDEEAIEE
jgi:hypothetical protein